MYGKGEATGLSESSADLVTICLVNHELPTDAARDILKEAHRILAPGGAIAVMDMNVRSEVRS